MRRLGGQSDEALADLDAALEADPGHVRALVHRARLHLERGETGLTRKDLDAALELSPHDHEARALATELSN